MEKPILKPNNIIVLSTDIKNGNFFKIWVELLKILHNLTDREMQVITAFLKKRYELSFDILDPVKLDKYLMSKETKLEIRSECNMSDAHFQVIMGKLKDRNIIVDGTINPRFIPNIKKDKNNFQLLFNLQWKD